MIFIPEKYVGKLKKWSPQGFPCSAGLYTKTIRIDIELSTQRRP